MDNEHMNGDVTIPIRDESIRLGQLLKLANLAEDGHEAKALIEDGNVRVDGEVETRRGRQVKPGSVVVLEDAGANVVSVTVTRREE